MDYLHRQNIKSEITKLVIFDLDGTIADTSEGIINSHRHALRSMGHSVPSDEILRNVIGEPLLDTYRKVFLFSEEDAVEAVQIYRAWYADHGIHQAKLYPGIADLLQMLKDKGILAGIATLKAERFAKSMMGEMGVQEFFHCIFGMNDRDTITKPELIKKCMESANARAEETCMIGDSVHDYNGALLCGVPFIGVSYGFGFREKRDVHFPICCSAAEIGEKLKL